MAADFNIITQYNKKEKVFGFYAEGLEEKKYVLALTDLDDLDPQVAGDFRKVAVSGTGEIAMSIKQWRNTAAMSELIEDDTNTEDEEATIEIDDNGDDESGEDDTEVATKPQTKRGDTTMAKVKPLKAKGPAPEIDEDDDLEIEDETAEITDEEDEDVEEEEVAPKKVAKKQEPAVMTTKDKIRALRLELRALREEARENKTQYMALRERRREMRVEMREKRARYNKLRGKTPRAAKAEEVPAKPTKKVARKK